jgi:cytochrome c oxidase subunit 4
MTPREATLTYAALLGLLALTVGTSFLPIGEVGTGLNLLFALAKATLIGLVFMHLRRSGTLVSLSVVAMLLWLGLLFGLTMIDVLGR